MLPEGDGIERERLRLRAMRGGDAPGLLALYSDARTMRYLARPPLASLGEAEELLGRVLAGYEDGTSLQLAIERKEDAAFLGLCLLFNFQRPSRRGEIGYALASPYWSRGYMSEALPALVDHAFGRMGLNRLEADIDPRNVASARVLARLGFRREGILRERWIVRGEVSDSEIHALLRREWAAQKA